MMMITFYIVGLLAAGAAWWLIRLALMRHHLKAWQLAGLALGIVLILFCFAWGVGSVLEGVPRAAAMGVVFFGFPGVVLLTLIGRRVGVGSLK